MPYLSRLNIIEFEDHSWVSGSLVKGSPISSKSNSILSHFKEVISSFFYSGLKQDKLHIKLKGKIQVLNTDKKGHFSKLLPKDDWHDALFLFKGNNLDLPSSYPFYFKNPKTKIEVISDIDDTVLVSHTASAIKRIRNILFLIPKKRKTILYTYKLMQAFKELDWRVSYLSKSESNLFPLISDFIEYHQLPEGALLLSPHLKWNQLAKPNKGRDYKLKHLRTIISNLPHKKFILLGDDTQRDMEIYTQVIQEFESQISMVFIRQTAVERNQKQEEMWKTLQNSGVDATYFDDQSDAELAIEKIKRL
jgi:phosphatidate phosphatase APP1